VFHEKDIAHRQLSQIHGRFEQVVSDALLDAIIGIFLGGGNQLQQHVYQEKEGRWVELPVEGPKEALLHFHNRVGTKLSPGEHRQALHAGNPVVLLFDGSEFRIVVVVVREVDLGGKVQGAQRSEEGKISGLCRTVAAVLGVLHAATGMGLAVGVTAAVAASVMRGFFRRAQSRHEPIEKVNGNGNDFPGQLVVVHHVVRPLTNLFPPGAVNHVLLTRKAIAALHYVRREVVVQTIVLGFHR